MSDSLIFKCPNKRNKCTSNRVEEVLSGVYQYSTISDIEQDRDEVYIDYGDVSYDGDEAQIERYQCAECGYVLKNENDNTITTPEGLVEWLKDKNRKTGE